MSSVRRNASRNSARSTQTVEVLRTAEIEVGAEAKTVWICDWYSLPWIDA